MSRPPFALNLRLAFLLQLFGAQTFSLVGHTRSRAGIVARVETAGVWVRVDEALTRAS